MKSEIACKIPIVKKEVYSRALKNLQMVSYSSLASDSSVLPLKSFPFHLPHHRGRPFCAFAFHSFLSVFRKRPFLFQITNEVHKMPITNIHLPKVTVCPPKNTFTDLNYDIMMSEHIKLDLTTLDELSEFAMIVMQEHMHEEFMTRLRKLKEENRFYNWYQGISIVALPYYSDIGTFVYGISTWAKMQIQPCGANNPQICG